MKALRLKKDLALCSNLPAVVVSAMEIRPSYSAEAMRQTGRNDHVAEWIERVRSGDESAAEQLWDHCFLRVVAFARRKMTGGPPSLADEEDIALSAMKSLCVGLRAGRFDGLVNDDSLWRLLLVIAARKVSDQVQYSTRMKRNVNRLDSVRGAGADTPLWSLLCSRPTPDAEAEIAEQLGQLLQTLEREDLKRVAILKMDGHTNDEIARKMNRGLSTIERKLRTIRSIWTGMV